MLIFACLVSQKIENNNRRNQKGKQTIHHALLFLRTLNEYEVTLTLLTNYYYSKDFQNYDMKLFVLVGNFTEVSNNRQGCDLVWSESDQQPEGRLKHLPFVII